MLFRYEFESLAVVRLFLFVMKCLFQSLSQEFLSVRDIRYSLKCNDLDFEVVMILQPFRF